jgi:death-on-curing family protein
LSSTETFLPEEVQDIVKFNKKLVITNNESFGVDMNSLSAIFDSVNSYSAQIEPDKRSRIIKKASLVISGITWKQPFNEGNKRTALAFGIIFLNKNGFDLSLDTETKKKIHSLLVRIPIKFEGDPSIYSEMEVFLSNNIFGVEQQ